MSKIKILMKMIFIFVLAFSIFIGPTTAEALPLTFNKSEIITNQDFYDLPSFWSVGQTDEQAIARIQTILENGKVPDGNGNMVNNPSDDSVLATYQVNVSFKEDPGDDEIFYAQKPGLIPYAHKTTYMSVAELVWRLSRTPMGGGCGILGSKWQNVCLDKNINPLFILALIQKESGLVYGTCSRVGAPGTACDQAEIDFRLDRAVGYYCYESSDKTKGCWDQNPVWAYYKGFFRQVYFATNMFRFREQGCKMGGDYALQLSGGNFYTGNTVQIDGQWFPLNNGFTCANYIYTPHISANLYNIMVELYRKMDLYYPSPTKISPEPVIIDNSENIPAVNNTDNPAKITDTSSTIQL